MTKHYILQALNPEKKSVYIDDVPNGKNCACTCAECGGKLVAKNRGRIKVHHFAHESGNDSIRCSQTALHLLAKEILLKYGMKLKVARGGIVGCPYARAYVPQEFCRECVFCCKEDSENIRCGIRLPLLLKPELQNTTTILVNQNKVMFPSEAKQYNESHFGWKMGQAVEHGIMAQMMFYRRW